MLFYLIYIYTYTSFIPQFHFPSFPLSCPRLVPLHTPHIISSVLQGSSIIFSPSTSQLYVISCHTLKFSFLIQKIYCFFITSLSAHHSFTSIYIILLLLLLFCSLRSYFSFFFVYFYFSSFFYSTSYSHNSSLSYVR